MSFPNVAVWLIEQDGAPRAVDEVLRDGPRHPVVGGLIDLGTVAATSLTAREIVTACTELDIGVHSNHWPLPTAARAELERTAAHGALFVVLPGPQGLIVASGADLPAMGVVEPCQLDVFTGSLRFARGEHVAESMFTEVTGEWSDQAERDLDERLRQLYGQ